MYYWFTDMRIYMNMICTIYMKIYLVWISMIWFIAVQQHRRQVFPLGGRRQWMCVNTGMALRACRAAHTALIQSKIRRNEKKALTSSGKMGSERHQWVNAFRSPTEVSFPLLFLHVISSRIISTGSLMQLTPSKKLIVVPGVFKRVLKQCKNLPPLSA